MILTNILLKCILINHDHKKGGGRTEKSTEILQQPPYRKVDGFLHCRHQTYLFTQVSASVLNLGSS